MTRLSKKAKKTFDRLGIFKNQDMSNKFDEFPCLGPYELYGGSYLGQYKDGLPHG